MHAVQSTPRPGVVCGTGTERRFVDERERRRFPCPFRKGRYGRTGNTAETRRSRAHERRPGG